MKVLSFMSQKGGVAKTSSTIEVATVLKQMGKRVLVIDMDESCSLTMSVGGKLGTQKSICEILMNEVTVSEAIQPLDVFDLIPGSERLSNAPKLFPDSDDIFRMLDFCEAIAAYYDYIFIDNAPSRSILQEMTYFAADYILIPTACDETSLRCAVGVENDLEHFKKRRGEGAHAKIIGYILTMYRKPSIMHDVAMQFLEQRAEQNGAFVSKVAESVNISKVKSMHTAANACEFRSTTVARDYYSIAEKIVEKIKE